MNTIPALIDRKDSLVMRFLGQKMAVILLTLSLGLGTLVALPHPAFAQNGSCYSNSYQVGRSGFTTFTVNGVKETVEYQLWYCSMYGENYGRIISHAPSGSLPLGAQAIVHRLSGVDGGDTWVYGRFQDFYPGQVLVSPAVYSPNNLAQGCLGDEGGTYCTAAY